MVRKAKESCVLLGLNILIAPGLKLLLACYVFCFPTSLDRKICNSCDRIENPVVLFHSGF